MQIWKPWATSLLDNATLGNTTLENVLDESPSAELLYQGKVGIELVDTKVALWPLLQVQERRPADYTLSEFVAYEKTRIKTASY